MDHGLSRGLTNYGDRDFALYLRRSFARSMGYSSASLAKPVVGIANSGSGFNNCHRHFPELIEAVKRGVSAAGGGPPEFPTPSLAQGCPETPPTPLPGPPSLGVWGGVCRPPPGAAGLPRTP